LRKQTFTRDTFLGIELEAVRRFMKLVFLGIKMIYFYCSQSKNRLNHKPWLWLLTSWLLLNYFFGALTNLAVEAAPTIWTRAAPTSQASSIIFARNEFAGLRIFTPISFGIFRADAVRLELLVQPAVSAGFAGISATSGAITVSNIS